MHVGRVAGRRAQRSACRHVIACKLDVMLDVLRAGLQLPVCVWLALLNWSFRGHRATNALCSLFEAPATYAGDCGFSINATGLSESQKREFGKLRCIYVKISMNMERTFFEGEKCGVEYPCVGAQGVLGP